MPRYFAELAYDGSGYHGWQIQENANTIQAEVNKALSTLLGEEVMTTGAGRTDTGVHAEQMYVHFDTNNSFEEDDLLYRLNAITPPDISFDSIVEVGLDAHARFDAIQRSYKYLLTNKKDPFEINRSYYFNHKLDLKAMNKACEILKEHKHFSSFSKSGVQTKTDICRIDHAQWTSNDHHITFEISADRFLRNMVRAIVGTMLDIGQHRIQPVDLNDILDSKDRSEAGTSVPAHGLYLTSIVYPENMLKENG